MRSRLQVSRLVVLLVSVLALANACALPLDDEARALSAEEFGDLGPDQLDELVHGVTTTTPLVVDDATNVVLYFIGPDGQLRTVRRPIAEPANVLQILDALEIKPTETESAEFPVLDSAVSPAFEAKTLGRLDRDNQPDLLTIQVARLLQQTAIENPRQAREAVSQIVCTITNLTFKDNSIPIRSVAFIDDEGNPLSITDDEGAAIDSPFSRTDFNDCEVADDTGAESEESTTTTES